jgi:glycerophosphoryl diester phosphodiesterase
MILISHRGNIDGINPNYENTLPYIDKAINAGYEVEIDLRTFVDGLWLGHDEPQYRVSLNWLQDRKDKLWIHCKDLESCKTLLGHDPTFKLFCHQSDEFTLTSNGKIWLHDLKQTIDSYTIIPLLSKTEIQNHKHVAPKAYGVCSDYISLLHE